MARKGQGLPINVVIMTIIGIILFGMGIGLFAKFSSAGDKEITQMTNNIEKNIVGSKCSDATWICAPSQSIRDGEHKQFELFIANQGQKSGTFTVKFFSADNEFLSGTKITKDGCGSIQLNYPTSAYSQSIEGGYSTTLIYSITAKNTGRSACSYVFQARLFDVQDKEIGRTVVTIRVE